MKNYFMRLIVLLLHIAFITCNIIAMEKQPLSLLEQSLGLFSGVKFETKEIINNRILIIGRFQNSKELVQEVQNIASNLHIKTDKSILLCPNMKYEPNQPKNYGENDHWVAVKRYTKISDGKGSFCSIPVEGSNTHYSGNFGVLSDSRLLTDSQLILYLLHPKALQVVPEIGNKSSIENSKDKHEEELSFMFHNKESVPVVVCVDEACVPKDGMEVVCQAFKEGNVKKFLNCLQYVKEEAVLPKNHAKKLINTSKPSFYISPLKMFATPIVLILIGYFIYHYHYKK